MKGSAGAELGLLADAYADYLLAGAEPASGDRLATAALQAHPVECELMSRYWDGGAQWTPTPGVDGPWAGRRCWVGVQPPADALPGDLWFDVVEVAIAVFVSTAADSSLGPPAGKPAPWLSMAPEEAWVSLRPMSVWQVAGYCRVVGRNVPASLVDSLSYPASCVSASGLTFPDADDVATFFGKSICNFWAWCAASATLSQDEFGEMWPGEAPEFGGEINSGSCLVLTRADAWWPNVKVLDDTSIENPRVVGDGEAVPGVRFRTAAMLWDGKALFTAADAEDQPVFDREAVGDR